MYTYRVYFNRAELDKRDTKTCNQVLLATEATFVADSWLAVICVPWLFLCWQFLSLVLKFVLSTPGVPDGVK